jgi:type IV pilus assembly protein PilC
MSVFSYRAINPSGKVLSGQMPANNERELEARLKNSGMELIDAKRQSAKRSLTGGAVPRKELINLCFHMEQTLRGGVLLTDAFADLIEGLEHQKMRDALSVILQSIRDGAPLSNALADFPDIFDDVFVGMVGAGEEAGALPEAFAKLGVGLRWRDELSSQVTKMMLYPCFTILVLFSVAFFMLLFLVPQLAGFIKSTLGTIPLQTKVLLALSDFVVAHWGKIIVTPLFVVACLRAGFHWSSEATRTTLDRLKFRLPLVGSVIEKVALARFASLFGMLYASGVPILRCLEVCQAAAGNRHLAQGIHDVRERIVGGMGLSLAFEASALFPNLVLRMIRIGEATGEIDKSLENVGYFFNREIQERISKIQAMIEPMLTVALGVLLGWLMMAVLGPIYDILGKLKI